MWSPIEMLVNLNTTRSIVLTAAGVAQGSLRAAFSPLTAFYEKKVNGKNYLPALKDEIVEGIKEFSGFGAINDNMYDLASSLEVNLYGKHKKRYGGLSSLAYLPLAIARDGMNLFIDDHIYDPNPFGMAIIMTILAASLSAAAFFTLGPAAAIFVGTTLVGLGALGVYTEFQEGQKLNSSEPEASPKKPDGKKEHSKDLNISIGHGHHKKPHHTPTHPVHGHSGHGHHPSS